MNEEKVIIRGTKYERKNIFKVCMGITLIIAALVTFILYVSIYLPSYDYHYYQHGGNACWHCRGLLSASACAKKEMDDPTYYFSLGIILSLVAGLLISMLFFRIQSYIEIVVTNKRVYGKTCFGRRVDLPLDSISTVGTSWFKGIAVATSSGKISFILLKNAKSIHKEITALLIDRQNKKVQEKPVISSASNADELKKYKELLDSGIITQEEFDKKKKQLLGL